MCCVPQANAVPAFARQTGKQCSTCHFQHFPILNSYGQGFKAAGYVDIKNKPLAGTNLSLADMLYASIFTKNRFQKSNGTDDLNVDGAEVKSTHSGELQLPDEFALLLGGRVGTNVGFLVEGQLAGDGPVLAGFKLPMMWKLGNVQVGAVPFTTDSLGASYGFELLSTGAVRNIRASENRSETSAQQYVFFQGTGPLSGDTDPVSGEVVRNDAGAAAGVAFVVQNPNYFIVLAPTTPNHLPGGEGQLGSLGSTYFRAALTPTMGGWALGAGVQVWTGNDVRFNDGGAGLFSNDIAKVSTKGWAVDAQALGNLAGKPLGLYLSHANAAGTDPGSDSPNLFNPRPNDRTATTITAEYGFLPGRATVLAAYRKADNGANSFSSDDAFTVGLTYNLYQNLQFQITHSVRDEGAGGIGRYGPSYADGGTLGGDQLTTLLLSAAF
jgi:hypothetical protein